jgi:hypothetical protein
VAGADNDNIEFVSELTHAQFSDTVRNEIFWKYSGSSKTEKGGVAALFREVCGLPFSVRKITPFSER